MANCEVEMTSVPTEAAEVQRLQPLTQIVIESQSELVAESESEIEVILPNYIVEIPSDDDPINHESLVTSESPLDEVDWFEKFKGTAMGVATFMGGIAYAAGLNPPGGIWPPHGEDTTTYKVGYAMLAANNPVGFKTYCFLNVVVLLTSFTTVILLLTGIPSSRRITLTIITVMIATSMIAAVVNVLLITIIVFMPPTFEDSKDVVTVMLNYMIFAWCVIMAAVVIAYVVKVIKSNKRRRTLNHNKHV